MAGRANIFAKQGMTECSVLGETDPNPDDNTAMRFGKVAVYQAASLSDINYK